MTSAMRRFHQQRRDSILKMLEEKKETTKTEDDEIKSLVNLNEMTLRIMAGVTTSLPVFIPLQSETE